MLDATQDFSGLCFLVKTGPLCNIVSLGHLGKPPSKMVKVPKTQQMSHTYYMGITDYKHKLLKISESQNTTKF